MVEIPDKGLTVLEVFLEFENRFGQLSVRDQTILVPDKVVMFLKFVDVHIDDLFTAYPKVTVKIGDVAIDQNFFLQESANETEL
mgnify:CR=1 FL=1